jgi:hypothetical protein
VNGAVGGGKQSFGRFDLVFTEETTRNTIRSRAIWFGWWAMQLARFAVVFAGLVGISEFLMSLLPCFAMVVVNPFNCLLVVGLYQDEVGFFHELRHYPVLLVLAIGIVIWWSRRSRRKRAQESIDRS